MRLDLLYNGDVQASSFGARRRRRTKMAVRAAFVARIRAPRRPDVACLSNFRTQIALRFLEFIVDTVSVYLSHFSA